MSWWVNPFKLFVFFIIFYENHKDEKKNVASLKRRAGGRSAAGCDYLMGSRCSEWEKWEKNCCPLGFLSWVTWLPSPLETNKLPIDTLMAQSLQECSAIFCVCVWVCLCGNIPSFFESVLLCSRCKMRVHVSAGTRVWVSVSSPVEGFTFAEYEWRFE